jgi:lycopene beta-cyclase
VAEKKMAEGYFEADSAKKYDYIIIGGGIAGLSLLYRLANSPLSDRSVLVVEQRLKNQNDRTLSFWTNRPTPFDEIVYHSWKKIRFASEDFEKDIDLGDMTYKTIRGIDFYRFMWDKLSGLPNVHLAQGRVERVENGIYGAYVYIEGKRFYGQWVFDSRFRPSDLKHKPKFGKQVLRQYFKGWIIETPTDTFNPDSATLFDFRVPQSGDMRFFYLLPFSPRSALLEYVGLRHTEYDGIMHSYVKDVLKIPDYKVETLEGGALVLSDRYFKRRRGRFVMSIGTAGGMVKPSSGYAFTRIQNDTEAIVASLLKYNHPFKVPRPKPFYYVLDSLMLEAMNRFTGKMKGVFTGMFKYNHARSVFRFLDERASFWEVTKMVVSIPSKHLFLWVVLTDEKKENKAAEKA